MHLLLYMSILLAASASYVPLLPRVDDPCDDPDAIEMLVFNDGPTSDRSAGIGAEFESPSFYFSNPACSLADTNAGKKEIIAGRTGTNFELTADTGRGAGILQAEYILDGRNIKVGSGDAAKAGAAAANDLIGWKPWTGTWPVNIDVANSNCNPWKIDGPSKNTDPATGVYWSPQITAPMPLEALYSLMKEQLADPSSPNNNILNGACPKGDCVVVVKAQYFQSKPNQIDGTKLTDDVFGFCTLVLSYAKAATKPLKADQSPKLFLTFMPRTEFSTLFKEVQSKLPGDLFALFNTLACYNTMPNGDVVLDTAYCSGSLSKPIPNNKFSDLSYTNTASNPPSNVNIKSWIEGIGRGSPIPDLLSQFDQTIDASIGGLDDKLEKMYNSQRLVPLIEFRDLDPIPTQEFEKFMDRVDSAIQALHHSFSNPPQKRKRDSSCTPSTTNPAATSMSCDYRDATPENPAECFCASGSSTITVKPMSISSVSVITQSCDFKTWPSSQPTVTAPPKTVSTNFPGCQVCTIEGPNEADCEPLPSSLHCNPSKTTTVLSADTSGVSVGTLTGTAFYSAITSAIDKVCQVPPNKGGGVGSFTCTETATATLASNILYTNKAEGAATWDNQGTLTLQVTEASYDSLVWYSNNKDIIARFAQNSTQGNCKSVTAENVIEPIKARLVEVPQPVVEHDTYTICQSGSNFQLIEVGPSNAKAMELSFSLHFQAAPSGNIFCHFLVDVVEFIEAAVNVGTDTEGAIPGEVEVDQKLLEACEGISA